MKETQQKQSGQSTNISQYLKGTNFPADREELQRVVKRNGAPNDIVDRINQLPNQRFNTENDVTNAFTQGGGRGVEGERGGEGGRGAEGGRGGQETRTGSGKPEGGQGDKPTRR